MPTEPTIVELVGLAGAGKSTLARQLTSEPPAQLALPPARVGSALAQTVASARFVAPYLREARGTPWFTRDQVRGLGYLHTWRRSLGRQAAPYVVLDHGPLFRLAQLEAFGPPVASTRAFRRWWDLTVDAWAARLDLVVWLDAPADLLVRRIRSRDQRHVLRTADDDACQRFLDRYRASYDRVLERVEDRSPGAVLRLRSEAESPSELAAQVRRRLPRGAWSDV